MTETNPNACSECGRPVPSDSKHQICPACLMAQAFASRTMDGDTRSTQEPPPSPEEIADKFPQFEVTECLGRGGMGVVYKARQKSLNRWVAIKILAPEKVGDEKFAEKFSREAQTLALLNHPNIVTVFDYGEADGLYYIVMEFIDGVNIRDLLRDGKIESSQALTIVPPICEALQYAHDKGIVHRDIKPENLLLDRDGRIKIADFGIASLVGATGEQSGTPPYMAPEQGAHTNVDHRADIYALGAVLYEMLTGERPTSPLDLPSQKVQLDIRIDDIVLRALSQEPERRYRTASEFRTVVENVTPKTSSPPQTSSAVHPPATTPLDPRISQGVGIAIMVAGALNGLSTLASLFILPFVRRIGSLETNQFLAPHITAPGMTPNAAFSGSMLNVVIIFSVLYTITVSALCIIGGRHMHRGSSRPWAFTGAIACCLTPLFWPLGLILGVGAIILLVVDGRSATQTQPATPGRATPNGPQMSAMAVIAAVMVVVPIILILVSITLIG
ncbi:serine/threonine-protein kinase [Haloferula sp.]|uniref:serine/threonine-protein kinase n=1 Tax=Haloferula sp. TaxID=2497595 RepID=UPI00329F7240